jgi:hypothetical protein
VDYLCSENGQRSIHQRWTKERLVAHPSKVITKESFWDPDHPAPSDAPIYMCDSLQKMKQLLADTELVTFELSADASQSAELDESVEGAY